MFGVINIGLFKCGLYYSGVVSAGTVSELEAAEELLTRMESQFLIKMRQGSFY